MNKFVIMTAEISEELVRKEQIIQKMMEELKEEKRQFDLYVFEQMDLVNDQRADLNGAINTLQNLAKCMSAVPERKTHDHE